MNHLAPPQSRCLHLLFVLASVATLSSCKPYGSGVEIELIEGKEFKVTVSNKSRDALVIDDRFFGLGVESSARVEVARENGTIIPPCSYLDYVATGSRSPLPPDEKVVMSIPLTAITATRCLSPDERYLFRALLVSGDEIVSRTDWVPFRAAPLE